MAAMAFPMIGEESVVIGATTLSCVLAELEDSKDFTVGGFDPGKRLQAVCKSSELPAESILKKSATVRGITMRVESVSKGASFATIILHQPEKA